MTDERENIELPSDLNDQDALLNQEDLSLDNFTFEVLESKNTEINYVTKNIEDPFSQANTDTEIISKEKVETIPTTLKILYSLPAFSKMSCLLILSVHAIVYFESIGASLLLMSFFTGLARCVEMIFKPILANWSDNSTFALGRRKPFMIFGCGFCALFLVMIFSTPSSIVTPNGISIWFGVLYVLFFMADTVTNIPYHSLGPELSNETKEREKLYIFFFTMQYIGVLFASVSPVIIQKYIHSCDCTKCDEISDPGLLQACIEQCQSICKLGDTKTSLVYICIFIGLFFVFSILLLTSVIKEKKGSFNKDDKSYMVPTIIRLLNNKPFMKLIIPWIIDTTVVQIFATMLPFFINYVLNPLKYCSKNSIDITSEYCDGTTWLGITIFSFFICCIGSMMLWHWIVTHVGKKKAWQSYSMISMISFNLFLFCEEGMMYWLIVFCVINALPAGGAYLNEVFLSDCIDYDEFITGKRNEGIYMVFSIITPKIVGVVAQSFPLSILSVLGFQSTVNGVISEQPPMAKEFIRFYFVAFPVFLALVSFLFKLKFPIDNEDKLKKLKNSIILQKQNIERLRRLNIDYYKVSDPIFDKDHIYIFSKNQSQKDSKIVADHFFDNEYISLFIEKKYTTIQTKLIWMLVILIISFFSVLAILIVTFNYLNVKSLSLIPLISLFVLTFLFAFIMINIYRFQVIRDVINGKYLLDNKYLTLYLYQMKLLENLDKDEHGLFYECGKMIEEIKQ